MNRAGTRPDTSPPAAAGSTRIFISYSRSDTARVHDLQRAAAGLGGLELYSFPYEEAPGDDWQQTFRSLIRTADGLVCLVGATTSQNTNIAWELDEAARAGIPILLVGREARALADRRGDDRVSTLDAASPADIVATLRELP